MNDIYRQQANALAYWLSKGKTFRQASAIVARRWQGKRWTAKVWGVQPRRKAVKR